MIQLFIFYNYCQIIDYYTHRHIRGEAYVLIYNVFNYTINYIILINNDS